MIWHVTANPRLRRCAVHQGLRPRQDRVVSSTLYWTCPYEGLAYPDLSRAFVVGGGS
jgi:hypothetical protein